MSPRGKQPGETRESIGRIGIPTRWKGALLYSRGRNYFGGVGLNWGRGVGENFTRWG